MTKPKKKPTKAEIEAIERKRNEKKIQDRREKVEKICELYSAGNVTIESCCEEVGITVRTFWNYTDQDSEFSLLYKKAKEKHAKVGKEGLREKAEDNLSKLITGFWIEETETEELYSRTGQLSGKRIKKKSKFIAPNVTAVIFALKNCDPQNWNEHVQVDISGEKQVFKIGDQIIEFN
jgi:hypothetical protein